MLSNYQRNIKRLKLEGCSLKLQHTRDSNLQQKVLVPYDGYPIDRDVPLEDNVFYDEDDKEFFNPLDSTQVYALIDQPFEIYKCGLIVDQVKVTRCTNPKRACILPKSETVVVEKPLSVFKNNQYSHQVVQEIGHVSWYKAYYYIDKTVNVADTHPIVVNQVLSKLEANSLPRWRPRTRYWDVEFVGSIEIPGTIFCTEQKLIKKRKFIRGDKPEVVHSRDVAHTNRDRTGCSVFRRHQPPRWTYNPSAEDEESNQIWAGLESRNQWVYNNLYNIWAGEEAVPDSETRERVYWTGPARHFERDDFFKCHYEPHCHVVEEVEEEVEEAEDIEVEFDVEQYGLL